MIKKISDKDKQDWQKFVNSSEKLDNKDKNENLTLLMIKLSSKKRTAAKPYSPTFIASPLFIEPPI